MATQKLKSAQTFNQQEERTVKIGLILTKRKIQRTITVSCMKLFLLSFKEAKNCIVKKAAHHSSQKRITDLEKAVKKKKNYDTKRKFTTLKEGDCISEIIHESPEEIRNLDHQKSITPKRQECYTTSSFEG